MIVHLTLAGSVHATLALSCVLIGAIQLLRFKGGTWHRARGYAFVYGMLIADGTAMLVYQFTGAFNMFHVGALANLACIAAGIAPMLQTPRPANWKLRHYYFMSWSYVGLVAAAATELIVRTMPGASHAQGWGVSAGVTVLVTAIGYILIERHRPPAQATSAASEAGIVPNGAAGI
jgi:uncharacterized membrane protein